MKKRRVYLTNLENLDDDLGNYHGQFGVDAHHEKELKSIEDSSSFALKEK